jgi:CubicO group peptidase (beta-lactamase class C family)
MKSWVRAFVLVSLVVAGGYAGLAQQVAPARLEGARPAAAPARAAAATATATPESVGISTQRLGRMHAGMQALIDRKEAGGIVTLVARDGKIVDVHTNGFQDVEGQTPMRENTIFRIASMSKPITSVAIMMLYEEGKLRLNDPVSRFIPAFKQQRVATEGGATENARRGITIRDLLTHRSGISYGFLNAGAVGNGYRTNGVVDGLTTTDMTTEQGIDKLAAQPLMSQPGAAWNYSLSTDVLGRVVEVASGQPFDVFLRERIFKPLGMVDTDFVVPEAKWSRFATVYSPEGNGIRPMKDPESFGNTNMSPLAYYKPGKKYFSGGAGLTSTIRDYARFALMLSGGGSVEGVRLLSPKSIELMAADHTGDLTTPGLLLGPGVGFGLGFSVVTDLAATQALGSKGMYGWSGIYGTNFWVDPKEHLVAIVMVQKYPNPTVSAAFQPLVYQALTKMN